uniref:hypothetical protein n=1 Tax=Paractinoplanes polyasparticus TaxID=2856853 RepID=UPI001C85B1E2|nr:hypothetical protein [Actinoplanes polyasparticus]
MASTRAFVDPDSILARTAREVLEAHAGGHGPGEGLTVCPACGERLPCAAGQAAAEVVVAAGLAEQSGLVAASRRGLGEPYGEAAPLPPLGPPTTFGSADDYGPSTAFGSADDYAPVTAFGSADVFEAPDASGSAFASAAGPRSPTAFGSPIVMTSDDEPARSEYVARRAAPDDDSPSTGSGYREARHETPVGISFVAPVVALPSDQGSASTRLPGDDAAMSSEPGPPSVVRLTPDSVSEVQPGRGSAEPSDRVSLPALLPQNGSPVIPPEHRLTSLTPPEAVPAPVDLAQESGLRSSAEDPSGPRRAMSFRTSPAEELPETGPPSLQHDAPATGSARTVGPVDDSGPAGNTPAAPAAGPVADVGSAASAPAAPTAGPVVGAGAGGSASAAGAPGATTDAGSAGSAWAAGPVVAAGSADSPPAAWAPGSQAGVPPVGGMPDTGPDTAAHPTGMTPAAPVAEEAPAQRKPAASPLPPNWHQTRPLDAPKFVPARPVAPRAPGMPGGPATPPSEVAGRPQSPARPFAGPPRPTPAAGPRTPEPVAEAMTPRPVADPPVPQPAMPQPVAARETTHPAAPAGEELSGLGAHLGAPAPAPPAPESEASGLSGMSSGQEPSGLSRTGAVPGAPGGFTAPGGQAAPGMPAGAPGDPAAGGSAADGHEPSGLGQAPGYSGQAPAAHPSPAGPAGEEPSGLPGRPAQAPAVLPGLGNASAHFGATTPEQNSAPRAAMMNPGRSPLEAPGAGQANRPPAAGQQTTPPQAANAGPAEAGPRPSRPKLEAPNMGQLNKPLNDKDRPDR